MTGMNNSSLHDSYAANYDSQIQEFDCHLADVLFGLCYEFIRPGDKLLDVGIGSGLSSQNFAQAGLNVYGMIFPL
jgi:2-polyprenyl-3-methyl-5-hydroxy-6-metoxy-1,4-benzoquinol methylase